MALRSSMQSSTVWRHDGSVLLYLSRARWPSTPSSTSTPSTRVPDDRHNSTPRPRRRREVQAAYRRRRQQPRRVGLLDSFQFLGAGVARAEDGRARRGLCCQRRLVHAARVGLGRGAERARDAERVGGARRLCVVVVLLRRSAFTLCIPRRWRTFSRPTAVASRVVARAASTASRAASSTPSTPRMRRRATDQRRRRVHAPTARHRRDAANTRRRRIALTRRHRRDATPVDIRQTLHTNMSGSWNMVDIICCGFDCSNFNFIMNCSSPNLSLRLGSWAIFAMRLGPNA